MVYVCNVEEELGSGEQDNTFTEQVRKYADSEGSGVVKLSGKIEEELSQLEGDDRKDMLEALGFIAPGLDRLILPVTNFSVCKAISLRVRRKLGLGPSP